MRIVHTSDWHLGRRLYSFSLLEEQRLFLESFLDLIREREADAVVIAGDVFDRPVPPVDAVQLYDRFLSRAVVEMGVPVLAVAGNHDSAGRLEFGSSLYRASGYHVAGEIRGEAARVTLCDAHGPVCFHLLPYLHPAQVRRAFRGSDAHSFGEAWRDLLGEGVRIDPAARNVAVAHGFFAPLGDGAEPVLCDSELSVGGTDLVDSGLFREFDYAALGHLHSPQRAGMDRVRYSGSPLKYSLSESERDKSVTLVELGPKGQVDWEAVPVVPRRDVRVVSGRLEELMEPTLHQNRSFDDYVFAQLSDTEALYPVEKLRTLFPNLLGVSLSRAAGDLSEDLPASSRRETATEEELFARFYREATGRELSPEALGMVRDASRKRKEEVAL